LRLNIIFLVCSTSVREHLLCPASDNFSPVRLWQGRRFPAIKPPAQLGDPNQASAADFQRRQFAPSQYPVNCSPAEPQTLSQMIYPDKRTLNIRLHFRLPFTLRPPIRAISLKNIARTVLLRQCTS
jgi:hypothetical protein